MLAPASRIRLLAPFALCGVLVSTSACDDDEAKTAPAEPQESVLQGGEAQTEAGKALERGRDGVKAAEQQLEVRDEQIIEAATPEKVERGQVP